jgi:hypothetical protein
VGKKTVFSQFDDEKSKTLGVPDGLCQDEDYGCWSARWGAGKVIRLDEEGNPDLIVEFPTGLNMTSCIFGGMFFHLPSGEATAHITLQVRIWMSCTSLRQLRKLPNWPNSTRIPDISLSSKVWDIEAKSARDSRLRSRLSSLVLQERSPMASYVLCHPWCMQQLCFARCWARYGYGVRRRDPESSVLPRRNHGPLIQR